MSAAAEACPLPSATKSTTTTPTASTTTAPAAATQPRPCCVCKPEKNTRDECLLFSDRGEEDCKPAIDAYRACMAGYGFKLP